MALRDRLPFTLPFGGNDPAATIRSGPDNLLGHTAPEPSVENLPMPRIGGVPFGQSGRANFWGLPAPDELNQLLIGPEGLRRFTEMYRTDAHVRRLVLAAWSPIVAGTWTLEPYGGEDTTDKDKQIADDIWWALTEFMKPNFYGHLYQTGPLLLRSGFLPFEQLWSTVKRNGRTMLAPRKLDLRLPSSIWRWWQDDFGELTHIGQILPNRSDVIIPASELTYYRLADEGDNWQGTSLLRHAWKHWYLKDKLERIDAVGQERKAVGVPVCYPPTSASPAQKGAVELLLANLHMSEAAYMMMPGPKAGSQGANGVPQEEWLIDIIKFDSSSGEGIHASIDYHQSAIAASFLTDFLELGHHQVGARATAEVQEDPFLTAVNGALLPPVIPQLNALVDRMRRLNWDSSDGSPTLKLTLHDEASLSEIAAYVSPLIQSGAMQVDPELEDYLRDRAGLPPANTDIRAAAMKAKQAGMDAAAEQLATTGETTQQEPPSPNADPAAAAAGTAKPKATGPNPIAGAVKSTGKIPAAGKKLSRAHRKLKALAELEAETDRRLAEIDAEMDALIVLDSPAPIAGGVIVHAGDTGRVLVTQRAADDSDLPDVFGSYEFPGGKLDGGPDGTTDASPWQGALREWQEETGAQLPAGSQRLGDFASPDGAYHAFVVRIPHETDLPLARHDRTEVAATTWQHPDSLKDGETSERMRALLPSLRNVLDGAKMLDAPLSGGTSSADGLQMVPEIPGGPRKPQAGQTCTCGANSGFDKWTCRDCGGADLRGWPDHYPDGKPVKQLDAAAAAEPTAKWFERLVSQDRLREAFDGARDHIEAACQPQTLLAARQLAHQAANGSPTSSTTPPADLVDALTKHYTDMYQLGRDTVHAELHRQRKVLAKTLDDPAAPDAALAGERLARARQRGEHSARSIIGKIQETLGRDQITGLKDATALTTAAETAAKAQLRREALTSTAVSVNDGRADGALAAGDVVGGIYTSVLDERSCEACIAADTGDVLSIGDALALGPPNPNCAGSDLCRCVILWVLSGDPAALALA